ncbi:MAG: hypothetical protein JWQ09_2502 [Segetibacter sp.]|nr:hypothetical protein [Segetibacter sp.]
MALLEYQIYQNRLLGAHIIWEFTKSFNEHSKNIEKSSATIFHVMPVLPLCLNKRVVEGIKGRLFKEGSLLRAINDNRDLFSGLQERMESMASITFGSIYIATQGKLILFDRDQMLLIPNSIPIPSKLTAKLYEDYKDILKASRRVGSWFAQLSIEEIQMYFNINY